MRRTAAYGPTVHGHAGPAAAGRTGLRRGGPAPSSSRRRRRLRPPVRGYAPSGPTDRRTWAARWAAGAPTRAGLRPAPTSAPASAGAPAATAQAGGPQPGAGRRRRRRRRRLGHPHLRPDAAAERRGRYGGGGRRRPRRRGRDGTAADEVPVVTGVPVTRPGAPRPAVRRLHPAAPQRTGRRGGSRAPATPPTPSRTRTRAPATSGRQPSYGPGYGQPSSRARQAYGDGAPATGTSTATARVSSRRTPAAAATRTQGAAAPRPPGQPRSAASRVRGGGLDRDHGRGVPPAAAASLSDMRNTLSAMQRGWQQGRSQTQRDTEGSESMETNQRYPVSQLDWLLDDLVRGSRTSAGGVPLPGRPGARRLARPGPGGRRASGRARRRVPVAGTGRGPALRRRRGAADDHRDDVGLLHRVGGRARAPAWPS